MHCTQCGKVLQQEAIFCEHCGTRQVAVPAVQPIGAGPPLEISSAQTVATDVSTQKTGRPAALRIDGQGQSSNIKKKHLFAAVAASVLVLLGGTASYLVWSSRAAANEAAQKLAQVTAEAAAITGAADARRIAAEDATERIEIAAAQEALRKRIAEEETLARASSGGSK